VSYREDSIRDIKPLELLAVIQRIEQRRRPEQIRGIPNTQLRHVQGDPWKAQEVSYSHAPLFAAGQLAGSAGLRAAPF
jgi:hypothetical protein